jgi:hypothetical protein
MRRNRSIEVDRKLIQERELSGNSIAVPDCVDTQACRPAGLTKDQYQILQLGVMDYKPNNDTVIFFCKEVLPVIRRSVPQTKFVKAGQIPQKEVLNLYGGTEWIHWSSTGVDGPDPNYKSRDDRELGPWLKYLLSRRPNGVAIMALGNRMGRTICTLLAHGRELNPSWDQPAMAAPAVFETSTGGAAKRVVRATFA